MTRTLLRAIAAAGVVLLGLVASLVTVTPGPLAAQAPAVTTQQPVQGGRGAAGTPPAPPEPRQLLEGSDEDDTLRGGSGDDWLLGKKGDDWLLGGAGRDTIDGAEGDDTIDGGADADIIDGGAGSDTIRGGDGDDTIDGGDDDDTVDAGAGNDDVDGGDGSDALRGGAGNDVLAGGDDSDMLNGGPGADRLLGGDGPDTLFGGPGDDLLFGGEADDSLDGELGDDRVDGGAGNDFVRGGQGNDTLLGSSGQDTLLGAEGHDTLIGGDDDDVLNGGVGSDWVLAGGGADVVRGGDGDDLIVIRAGDVTAGEMESIDGGAGTDVLILNGFGRPLSGGASKTPEVDRELTDPLTGGTYRVTKVEGTEFTQLLTSVGETEDGSVSLLLVNPSSTANSGRLLVYGADGAVVPATGGGAATREVVPFTVPALGSARLDDVARGPATIQIFSTAPLGAVLRDGAGGVHESVLVDSAIVPVLEDAKTGIATGLVLANSVTAINVNLSLHRLDGGEIDGDTISGAREVALPPYTRTTIFVRDLFPRLGDFRGALSVDGDASRPQEGGPFTVTALERGPDGHVATSPAVPLLASAAGARVYFPNVTAGGGAATSLMVTNASRSRRAQGTVRFFDESGQPWLIAVNGLAPTATVPFDLAAHASIILTLPGGGPSQRGSAQAESAPGSVGGLMRVTSAMRTSHLPAGTVAQRVIAAVRYDRANGITTRVAVASTGAAAGLRLTLRTASGGEVPGATADVRLPANGQIVGTLEDLFPAATLAAFDGTLAIAADGGPVAVTAMEVQPDLVTGLPVAALP